MGAEADGADWAGYYAAEAGRPPQPLLKAVLARWQKTGHQPGFAIDLGCGDGADTFELLPRGWTVLAVDRQPAAIALVERNVPEPHWPQLQTLVADYTNLVLPPADLIYCGWSLPRCPVHRHLAHHPRITAPPRPDRRPPARPPRRLGRRSCIVSVHP